MNDAAASGRHVFLVRSSLQYLLATALAADLRQRTPQTCRMLFVPDLLDPSLFLRATQDCAESPFDRVQLIEPRRALGSPTRRRESGAVRRELVAALQEASPVSVTVFNDQEEVGQTVLIATARRFAQAERRCAEDGAFAYTDFVFRAHSLATRLRQKLRVGREWHDVRVLGTHPLVQRFIAMHPALLRPQLRQRNILPFPIDALASAELRSLAAALCRACGFEPETVPALATVLTVSHSSYAQRNPEYPALVRTCARRLGRQPGHFFVKYHPRETEPDYLGLCGHGGAQQIARTLPVECLYLMLRDRPLTVVGGMSTTLLTAGLLMPQVRCAALTHPSAAGDAWDSHLLDALRITPLSDEASIGAYFGS